MEARRNGSGNVTVRQAATVTFIEFIFFVFRLQCLDLCLAALLLPCVRAWFIPRLELAVLQSESIELPQGRLEIR